MICRIRRPDAASVVFTAFGGVALTFAHSHITKASSLGLKCLEMVVQRHPSLLSGEGGSRGGESQARQSRGGDCSWFVAKADRTRTLAIARVHPPPTGGGMAPCVK